MNIDDLIATARPRTTEVPICARGDLVDAHEEAVRALGEVADQDDSLASPAVLEASRRVKAIEDEQEAATVTFMLTAVSRETWADLLVKHAPSREQRRAGHDHDPATFPIAAVAACSTDPVMTYAKAKELNKVLHAGEWNKLWMAALDLNVNAMPHPKLSAATELLRANGRSSTTSGPGASPDPDSLAGGGAQ